MSSGNALGKRGELRKPTNPRLTEKWVGNKEKFCCILQSVALLKTESELNSFYSY
jgi:hypothetical protein